MQNFCIIQLLLVKVSNLVENEICRISASNLFQPLGRDAEFLHHTVVVENVQNLSESKIYRISASNFFKPCRISASFICVR